MSSFNLILISMVFPVLEFSLSSFPILESTSEIHIAELRFDIRELSIPKTPTIFIVYICFLFMPSFTFESETFFSSIVGLGCLHLIKIRNLRIEFFLYSFDAWCLSLFQVQALRPTSILVSNSKIHSVIDFWVFLYSIEDIESSSLF